MSERERIVTCRDRHPVKFSWNDTFPFLFIVWRADKNLGNLTSGNLYPRLETPRFRCEDCSIVFSCEVSSFTPSVPEIADILRNNTVLEAKQLLREKAFKSLDLEPDYFSRRST
jgi:hypothetical protein